MNAILSLEPGLTWAFFLAVLPVLLKGLAVTIAAALSGYVLALVLGIVFALLRSARFRPLALATMLVLELLRDTPLLILLFFLYYVLPGYGLVLPAFAIGTLAIGFQYGAYLAEVYRGGIEAIPGSQWEAAAALNMTRLQTYRDVVIPQAVPRVVPAMGNYLASVLKETPLLSTISLFEMFSLAMLIGDRTYEYIVPLTTAGGLMLLLTSAVGLLVSRIETHLPRQGIPLR